VRRLSESVRARNFEEERLRYLVTGGAGFIGSHVVDELVRRWHDVVVLDDLSTGKEENLASVRGKIDLRVQSIGDLSAVKAACTGADYVMHLAAQTSVPRSIQKPLETNVANIDGTLNVLVAARDAKVKRFVYAASSAAYGETPNLPKTESMPAAPISPYGVSKYVGELYAQCFGRAYGLENVSVRFFNVFGPRQDPSSQYSGVLSRFMLAVIRGERPVVFGDGSQSRDFTYIDNIVSETLSACEAKNASGMVFNGGTGLQITLNEVLQLLERVSGRKISPKHEPPRTGDILHSQADISLAHRVLGYRPVVDFEEGLRRTWDWYKTAYGQS
jgi:UDP-N-acetylglucosamine/UDP-N-acetyl-alpha-D-glucosaminouronate 4-epimerase